MQTNKELAILIEARIVAYDSRVAEMLVCADDKAMAIARSQIEVGMCLAYEIGRANAF